MFSPGKTCRPSGFHSSPLAAVRTIPKLNATPARGKSDIASGCCRQPTKSRLTRLLTLKVAGPLQTAKRWLEVWLIPKNLGEFGKCFRGMLLLQIGLGQIVP